MENQNQNKPKENIPNPDQSIQKTKDQLKQKAEEKAKNKVDEELYREFTDLKFIKLDGGELKEEYEKKFIELEKRIKACEGKKPIRTMTAAFGSRLIRLISGIPVTDEIYEFIKAQGHEEYYFG